MGKSASDMQWEAIEQPPERVETDLDRDLDTLHVLPLANVPVTSPALRKLKLIKNTRLKSVVEVYNLKRQGSLQVEVGDLGSVLGWSEDKAHPDMALMGDVGDMPSFDIYSLRYLLRDLGHDVGADPNLQLSEDKTSELSEYMTVFTRPLITRIYGSQGAQVSKPSDLLALFNDPDRSKVLQRLGLMADEMDVRIEDVPNVLENYSDVLLSLAFYKRCLDQVTPIVSAFLETMATVTSNQMLSKNKELMEVCAVVEAEVNELTSAIAQRFQTLDQISTDIWSNASAKGFKDLEEAVEAHHLGISSVLCGLAVKMGIWDKMFPDKEDASPAQLADFINFQMKQGLETMQEVQVASLRQG